MSTQSLTRSVIAVYPISFLTMQIISMDKGCKRMTIALISLLVIIAAETTITSANKGICITKGIEGIDSTKLDNESGNFSVDIPICNFLQCCHEIGCCIGLDGILKFQHIFKSNINITAILTQGIHAPNSTKTRGRLHIAQQNTVILSGNARKETVILQRIDLVLSDNKNTTLNNFTADDSSVNIYGGNDPYVRTAITIKDCIIANSQIILTNIVLYIRDCEIKNSTHSAIISYSSFILFAGVVKFSNNSGGTGGALNLRGSRIKFLENSNVIFQNNSASVVGGAIYVDSADLYVSSEGYNSYCFYGIEKEDSNCSITFNGNIANNGGDHIFGASLKSNCTAAFRDNACNDITSCGLESYMIWNTSFNFHPPLDSPNFKSISAISSKPTRVCLCDNHQPQCTDIQSIFHVYPGEYFNVSAVVVGGDFGTTIGVVYAHLDNNSQQCAHSYNDIHTMHEQFINENKICTNLTYCFYGNKTHSTLTVYLTTTTRMAEEPTNITTSRIESSINDYLTNGSIDQTLLHTPIVLNITFLPCPLGFILLENPWRCDCHPHFERMRCTLKSGKGYISWNTTRWISAIHETNTTEGSKIITNRRCPFSYCKSTKKNIDLQHNPDAQCDFNRAGKLCGKCKDKYSLAIGSSHCIQCPNNNNLALLIFFAAVGPLLVFMISVFNLTVTKGTVNGLIFYANIVWAYQSVFFPSIKAYNALHVLKPFIAWLNLDFGIETCFYRGLDMYSKTWLQFIFPVYTATLFFIGIKLSSKLSKLFGSRSVPTLATLLALSFTKLLRTIIAGLQLAQIKTYTSEIKSNSTSIVWALDGNLEYGKYPHGFLLFVVLACLVLLWLPYTLILFSMQWLRKIDHYRPLKLIARYKPVYDAYFAPFKDNHHYWFGVLLLAQGALLLVSSLILNISSVYGLLLLLLIVLLMLCYINFMKVYKRNAITLLESSFYINLILLTAGMLYLQEVANYAFKQEILLTLSIGIAFIEFCAIVMWNLISRKLKKYCKTKAERGLQLFQMNSIDTIKDESDSYDKCYIRYRDSVLN